MQEFTERASPIDTMESAYKELSKSQDYIDETRYTTEQLKEKASYWLGELQNPLRSSRNLEEVSKLVNILLFEIKIRGGDVDSLEAYNKIPAEDTV